MSENNLIQRLRDGNESAFKELILSFSSKLMTVAKVYTDSVEDAEDVLQDAFIVSFEKIHKFHGDEIKAFYGWMKRVTINLALDKNKKKYKKMEIGLGSQDISMDETAISKMTSDEIMEIIFSLPSGYKQVFALHVLEGYSHKEISELLGVKPSTSRSQLVRAKSILRDKVNNLFKVAV